MTRSEAARLNGSKSRGPVTEAGKARSARNAMKHGLTAKSFLLPLEDPSAFEELHAAYLEEFSPQSIAEQDCVEEMVAAVYRQRRLWALDTASLINRMDMMAIDVDLKYKSIPPANRIALAFDSRAAAKCAPDLYLRYDAHLSRAYDRALQRLERIRNLKAANSISHPAPSSGPIPVPNPYSDPKPRERNEPEQDQEPRVVSSAPAAATADAAAASPAPNPHSCGTPPSSTNNVPNNIPSLWGGAFAPQPAPRSALIQNPRISVLTREGKMTNRTQGPGANQAAA
jgi:hypothetical protein